MPGRSELQVLVVEDNPADAFRVREALEGKGRGRFLPTFVTALREAEAALPTSDLVLLDLTLPDSSGAETVARVRAKAPGTPVVVLSGERDEELAFLCLQHGAQDVLLKGAVDGDALVRALSCALERHALAGERDAALARARAGEAELKGVLESVREGIVVADPRGRVLFANSAAETLLGWSSRNGGRRTFDFPVEAGPVEIGTAPDPGRASSDGSPSVLEIRSASIRWEGEPATLTSLHEAPLHRHREARRREERDRRTEEVLRDSTRRLASGVARGLGEPLGVVLEEAFELSDGGEAAAYGPALRIQKAAWQASGLVRLLLASAGEARAMPKPVDLSEVVASLWDRLEEIGTDRISLVRDLTVGLPRVLADRRLVEQALLSLVEHARHSVGEGGTVTVRTFLDVPPPGRDGEPPREGGLLVALSVSDSGPVLGPGACSRIFEPYYSTDVLGIGTGIGLAPVRGIALQSGGEADVLSVHGRGTTVCILLPVLDQDEGGTVAGLEALEGEGGYGAPLPRGRETILLSEGEPWLRWRVHSILQDLGYRVLPAARVGDAVAIAADFRGAIPLLVSEASAEGMGGAVLAGVLRCRRPGMRALLLQGPIGREGPALKPPPGARILPCPFRRQDLAAVVRELLDLPATGSVTPDASPIGVEAGR